MSARDGALRWPQGDPGQLAEVAGRMALVSARADQTVLAREGGRGWGLARAWSGPAFEAARAEAAVAAARSSDLGAGLARVVAALQGYAAALTEAQRRVSALREEWDRGRHRFEQARHDTASVGDPLVDAAALTLARQAAEHDWARLQEDLRGRHTAATVALTAAAERATTTVWGVLATLPGESPDAVRSGLLATLPLTDGALRVAQARALVAGLVAAAQRPVQDWGAPEAALVASLGDRVHDPLVAQALVATLPPEAMTEFVARLLTLVASVSGQGSAWQTQFDGVLAVLGTAFVRMTTDRPWAGLDDATSARMQSWQRSWFEELSRWVAPVVGDPRDDVLFRGVAALGALLDHAGRAAPGQRPGVAFVGTVGVAMVEADRRFVSFWPQERFPAVPVSAAEGIDAMAALMRSVRGAPDSAATLLLAPLQDGRTVAQYLAGERVVRGAGGPTEFVDALAAVLAETATGRDERSVSIAGAALDGFGTAAETVRRADAETALAVDPQLQGLRFVMADLLSIHPDAVWATINDPFDASAWPPGAAGDRPWAVLGENGWTLRVLNRSRLGAIIAELGTDHLAPGEAAQGPPTAPALARLLNAVLATGLTDAHVGLSSPDPQDRAAGIVRLGQVTGFVVEAARQGVLAIQSTADDVALARRAVVDSIAGAISLPAALRKSLPTAVAGVALDLVRSAVTWIGYDDTSVDNAARASADTAAARARVEVELRRIGWDLVSATGWWSADDDPLRWLGTHPGVSFCGPDGHPLPLAQMTATQRERFLAWSAGVPAYTTVPTEIVAQIEEGARAVRTSMPAR